MNTTDILIVALQTVAVMQATVAVINLALVRLLHWEKEVANMSLLLRQVFQIHAWYISLTMAIFAVLTWRFAGEMARGTNPALQWLNASIAFFWGLRVVLQFVHYSPSHWRGRPGRTVIHCLLIATYLGFTATYLLAAIGHK